MVHQNERKEAILYITFVSQHSSLMLLFALDLRVLFPTKGQHPL
jgi:hypothetical protein